MADLVLTMSAALDRPPDAFERALEQGERWAVARAFDQHHGVVRALARRLVADADAAEDVVQEGFVALPRAMRRYSGKGSLRSFILGITVQRCKTHRRARARRLGAHERFAAHPSSGQVSSEQMAAGRQLAERLEAALLELRHGLRAAFVLVAVEERSAAEAAEILCIPEATVRTRVFNARKKLKAAMGKELER